MMHNSREKNKNALLKKRQQELKKKRGKHTRKRKGGRRRLRFERNFGSEKMKVILFHSFIFLPDVPHDSQRSLKSIEQS